MNKPRTFKTIPGPFRIDGAAHGPFTAVGGRRKGVEFILLVKDAHDAAELFSAMGMPCNKSKAQRVAVVKCDAMKRIKE